MRIISILVFLICNISLIEAKEISLKELRSEHFIIKYQRGVSTGYIYKIKHEAEYDYRYITQEFHLIRGNFWTWENRARIFIAASRQSFLKNFPCYKWSQACVDYRKKSIWTYAGQKGFFDTLRHEMTHIIFREYIGYRNFPLWLDEGMAVYMEQSPYPLQVRRSINYMRKAIRLGRYFSFNKMAVVDVNYLNSLSESKIDLFYQQAFSMIYFLIKRYGRDNFAEFLRGLKGGKGLMEALTSAYPEISTMNNFQKRWKKFYLL